MTCIICGWQPATRKGRCDACRQFYRRHGVDKSVAQVITGWERAVDKALSVQVVNQNHMGVTH
jgi:hypothetical protein